MATWLIPAYSWMLILINTYFWYLPFQHLRNFEQMGPFDYPSGQRVPTAYPSEQWGPLINNSVYISLGIGKIMAIITEEVYFTERKLSVPGWKPSPDDEPPRPPFFRIDGQKTLQIGHDCTEEQAAEIPEIHHDGVFVKILNSSIVQLWAELDEYMTNDGVYDVYIMEEFGPGWDEASRHWVISFYHRIR